MTCNECKRMTECGEDAFINGAKFDPVASAQYCIGFEPYTNADRIRAMSDEELAKFIPDWSYTNACKCDEKPYVDCNNECDKCVLEWLQQPAGDAEQERPKDTGSPQDGFGAHIARRFGSEV